MTSESLIEAKSTSSSTTRRRRRRPPFLASKNTRTMALFAAAAAAALASRSVPAAAAAFSPAAASAVRSSSSRRGGGACDPRLFVVAGGSAFAAALADLGLSASARLSSSSSSDGADIGNGDGTGTDGDGITVLRPLVVCGPSGAGKGTIIERFMTSSPPSSSSAPPPPPPLPGCDRDEPHRTQKFAFTVSHTTRSPRPGEIDGVHYHFTSMEDMREAIRDGNFLEHAEVHGNVYGTSLSSLEAVQDEGKIPLLDIDVQGVRSVKETRDVRDARLDAIRRGGRDDPPDSILRPRFVFVAPPSLDVLLERLRGRGTETEESLARRTANAEAEMDFGLGEGNVDAVVVNDDLDRACEEFGRVVRSLYGEEED
mmetsp:Transcript_39855/g.119917  ORF Transcript_39855/g.119917 Transcript_39855/m.119917 type:complete len:370 (-) Transcript_39855:576-1685(-)